MPSRRTFFTALSATLALPLFTVLPARAAAPVFFTNPGCGCCHAWTDRMKAAGMPVTLVDSDDLAGEAAKLGVPQDLQGCHVGEIEGYVISGHVPPEDVRRLLAERTNARGLLVPGMPVGSPGMEMGEQKDRFDVLLLAKDGTTSVFASHG